MEGDLLHGSSNQVKAMFRGCMKTLLVITPRTDGQHPDALVATVHCWLSCHAFLQHAHRALQPPIGKGSP